MSCTYTLSIMLDPVGGSLAETSCEAKFELSDIAGSILPVGQRVHQGPQTGTVKANTSLSLKI